MINDNDNYNYNPLKVVGFASDDAKKKSLTYADIYHSATRYSTGFEQVPIVLPRSILWSFKRGRVVLGRESLSLQGHSWNHEEIDELEATESQMQDLAGNAPLGFYSQTGSTKVSVT